MRRTTVPNAVMHYDIFNGDADGIFALHQYRLRYPQPESRLVTGVKRDIRLLSTVEDAADSEMTVFDLSLMSNRESLQKILTANNRVTYFDHHLEGERIDSPLLTTHIDPSPTCCTSLIVNTLLDDRHYPWAISGAYGDNLQQPATTLAEKHGLSSTQCTALRELGELFNYNGYGRAIDDLHFHPAELYRAIRGYEDPFAFLREAEPIKVLRAGYRSDLERTQSLKPERVDGPNRIYFLPDAPWARRVVGTFANNLCRNQPDGAVALISDHGNNSYMVSVRAPKNHPQNAGELCKRFPTGGGRAAAAGINELPAEQLDAFIDQFNRTYRR